MNSLNPCMDCSVVVNFQILFHQRFSKHKFTHSSILHSQWAVSNRRRDIIYKANTNARAHTELIIVVEARQTCTILHKQPSFDSIYSSSIVFSLIFVLVRFACSCGFYLENKIEIHNEGNVKQTAIASV